MTFSKVWNKEHKFKYGDMVREYRTKSHLIVIRKARGYYYLCVDVKGEFWNVTGWCLNRIYDKESQRKE